MNYKISPEPHRSPAMLLPVPDAKDPGRYAPSRPDSKHRSSTIRQRNIQPGIPRLSLNNPKVAESRTRKGIKLNLFPLELQSLADSESGFENEQGDIS